MSEELTVLVQCFDRDAAGNGRLMRELLKIDRRTFFDTAIHILARGPDSRGTRYLTSVLAADELLLPAMCEPGLPQNQAVALARAAFQAGVMADVVLARHLSEFAASLDASSCPPEFQRMIDILAEISDGSRVLPCLTTLISHPNPYVQSKAVLLIGKINRNVRWVRKRMVEPNGRVRANAVETLWGVDSEEARELLRGAVYDPDNRVAGNAAIAIYRLGDNWVIPELLKMAEHESPLFRATASWAMGESGDPRFTRALGKMVGEHNTMVRTRAFKALASIRTATLQAHQAGEWRIVARHQRIRRKGKRELRLEISSMDGREQFSILPTQLILSEDAQEVVNYSVDERPVPSAMAITFILPRTADLPSHPIQVGVSNSLTWKRAIDLWCIAPYIPTARPEFQVSLAGQKIEFAATAVPSLEGIPVKFTYDTHAVEEALRKFPPKTDCSDLWSTIRRSVESAKGRSRVNRHIIVYSEDEMHQPSGYPELVSAAMASRTTISAISRVSNPALEGLCQMTQGVCQTIASDDEITLLMEETCLSLQSRYTVRYDPTPDSRELKVMVTTPNGWGETMLAIPPPSAMGSD